MTTNIQVVIGTLKVCVTGENIYSISHFKGMGRVKLIGCRWAVGKIKKHKKRN